MNLKGSVDAREYTAQKNSGLKLTELWEAFDSVSDVVKRGSPKEGKVERVWELEDTDRCLKLLFDD